MDPLQSDAKSVEANDRKPAQEPSEFKQSANSQKAWKWITVKRVVLVIVILPLLIYIVRELRRDALIIDPFSVPKRFQESGLTSEVVADRIRDAMLEIEASGETNLKRDHLISLHDEGSTPDMQIPGTGLGLKTLMEITRSLSGIHRKHVGGDIVALAAGDAAGTAPRFKVTVYITKGRNREAAMNLDANTDDISALALQTAEKILEQTNPYAVAAYRYDRYGDAPKVIALLERVVSDRTQDREHQAAAYALWGFVLNRQQRYDDAVTKFEQAFKRNPKNTHVIGNWGNALKGQKRYDEAIAKYRQVLDLDPKDPLAHNNWGEALREQKKYDEAIAEYQKAIEIDPNYALAYNNWGEALREQKKYDEAIAQYMQAATQYPNYAEAYHNWDEALIELKKNDEAAARYEKTIKSDSRYARAYFNWGNMLKEQTHYDEAIARYKKAAEIDPKYRDAYGNWGNTLKDQKKYDEAIAKYKKVLELDPNDPLAYNNWGEALREQKKYDEAIAKYQRAVEIDPKYALAYTNWGEALKAQNRLDEAKEKFARARELQQ